MAASFNIPAPALLDMSSSNLVENWKKIKQRIENFELATGITSNWDDQRVATFLSVIGQEAVDTYNTFVWPEAEDGKKIDKVKEMFETFCAGKENVTYERYIFNKQEPK